MVLSHGMNNSKSVRNLLMEYQHLFAMSLNELGKTSLVQHDIKVDDSTPFKECYQRIPHISTRKLRNIFRK